MWNRILGSMSAPLVLDSGSAIALVYLRLGNLLHRLQGDPFDVAICVLSARIAAVFLIEMVRKRSRTPGSPVVLLDCPGVS